LITPHEIPERVTRLARVVFPLLASPAYKRMTIVRREEEGSQVEWFPEDPFSALGG
jgi:hypothetical protein